MEVQIAVARLNLLLPLKARQDQLSPVLKQLHQDTLVSLVRRGRPLSNAEISQYVGEEVLVQSLSTLAENDLVVLNPEATAVVGAYPVTIEQTVHLLEIESHTIYAMCALDALSVATLFDIEVLILSRCHVTAEPIRIRMRAFEVMQASPEDVCVGIRWQMPQGSAAHSMCMEMVFLKDEKTARLWQGQEIDSISIFSLPDAIEFAAQFFLPILAEK